MGSFLFRIAKAAGTQKVKVKATTRKTASGKTTTVRQHTATRKKAEPKAPSKPKPSAKPNAVNVEVPPPTTAWIAKSDIPKMEARIDKLNKRAKRIGTEPISLVFGETTKVPLATRTGERIWREKVEVTVTGPEPRFAGWQFVASIKAMDAGNLLLAIDKQTVPAKYRKASMLCDHCGTNRKRKATYVIRNVDTGEYKQVGKTCLKDFMGHGNPAQFAEHLSEVSELLQEIEAWPDDDSVWLEDPLPRSPYFATQRYLEFVAHDIAANGWVKRGDSGWNNDTSTADSALYVMFPGRGQDTVEPPPSAQKKAKAALAWIRKKPQKWANNDYLWNLWVACREDLITIKETGIVASLIPLYERETNQERQAKAAAEGKGSQHVGTVGERREFKLTITNIRPYEGNYGLVYITKLVDDDGNEFTWFASKEPGEEGKTYNITATIKKHDEFRGVPQTHITRGKVAPLRKSFLFRITKAAGQKVSVKGSTQRTRTGVRVQPAYQAKRSKATAKVTTPKGNVQYVYDEDTLAAAKAEKFRRVAHLAEQLPEIIGAVQEQMTQPDTPLGKVVAAVVALIDRCQFRIGTDEYAEKHGTYGVTTLRPEHVTVEGDTVHFRFTGKKQVPWDKATTDPDLAEFIDHLSDDGPGDRLFWYHTPSGEQRPIRASHVNAWLREYGVSAKDFRTYHATRLCYEELKRASSRKPLTKKEIKARVKAAVEATAERLGHTPAVCRQSYILPAVIEDFEANGGKLSINPWKAAKRMGKSFLFTRWA